MAREPTRPPGDAADEDSPPEVSRTHPRIHRRYTIHEIVAKTRVSHRKIHYWVSLGLLGPPLGYGRGATYTDDHLHDVAEIDRWMAEKRAWPTLLREAIHRADHEGATDDLPQLRTLNLRTRGRLS